MKKLLFIAGIVIAQVSFGAGNSQLKNEITDQLVFDLSKVELNQKHQDFVIVSFYISNGVIEIAEILGTQEELTLIVKNKLSRLEINEAYEEGTLYQYKLTFKKV